MNEQQLIDYEINKLAPDITDEKTTFKILLERVNNLSISQQNQLLEDIIMNQKIILSGIGGKYNFSPIFLNKKHSFLFTPLEI